MAPELVRRLAGEEAARARSAPEAEKRTKRRLHQLVGAFSGAGLTESEVRRLADRLRQSWRGTLDGGFLDACRDALGRHASTRERIPLLEPSDERQGFFPAIWRVTGEPGSVVDLACGLNPVAAPWMGLAPGTRYVAYDIDAALLAVSSAVLELLGLDARVSLRDVAHDPPTDDADVALLLKSVTTLDQQDPSAAARLLSGVRARDLVVSFPTRSLAGRGKGMERTYRARFERLSGELGPLVAAVTEIPLPGELVHVVRRADA